MPLYRVEIIIGGISEYLYNEAEEEIRARSPEAAAQKYGLKRLLASNRDGVWHLPQVTVAVRRVGKAGRLPTHREADCFLVSEALTARARDLEDIEVFPAVSAKASKLARQLLSLLEEISNLDDDDAQSLLSLLESIHIDTSTSEIEEEHPASAPFPPVCLSKTDALAGVRLFMHATFELPYLDAYEVDLAEHGGFSPRETS